MIHSQDISEIAKALLGAKQEFRPAVKNSTNPHFKSKYVDLSGVIEATEPALLKYGLVVIQGVQGSVAEQSVTITTRLMHISGQWIEDSLTLPAMNRSNFDPQSVGSAISYGRRYGRMALLDIAAEDDDGNAASNGDKDANRYAERPSVKEMLKASLEVTPVKVHSFPQPKAEDHMPQATEPPEVTPSHTHTRVEPQPVQRQAPQPTQRTEPKGVQGKTITDPRRKRMFAIAMSNGVTREAYNELIAHFGFINEKGVPDDRLVTTDKYEEICSKLQK